MNFYDYGFIFIFLPLVLIGAALIRRAGQQWQYIFLILASLMFYATWNTAAIGLLAASVCLNFLARIIQPGLADVP